MPRDVPHDQFSQRTVSQCDKRRNESTWKCCRCVFPKHLCSATGYPLPWRLFIGRMEHIKPHYNALHLMYNDVIEYMQQTRRRNTPADTGIEFSVTRHEKHYMSSHQYPYFSWTRCKTTHLKQKQLTRTGYAPFLRVMQLSRLYATTTTSINRW